MDHNFGALFLEANCHPIVIRHGQFSRTKKRCGKIWLSKKSVQIFCWCHLERVVTSISFSNCFTTGDLQILGSSCSSAEDTTMEDVATNLTTTNKDNKDNNNTTIATTTTTTDNNNDALAQGLLSHCLEILYRYPGMEPKCAFNLYRLIHTITGRNYNCALSLLKKSTCYENNNNDLSSSCLSSEKEEQQQSSEKQQQETPPPLFEHEDQQQQKPTTTTTTTPAPSPTIITNNNRQKQQQNTTRGDQQQEQKPPTRSPVKLNGVSVLLLRLGKNANFRGCLKLVSEILSHILEDDQTLRSQMEAVIARTFQNKAKKKTCIHQVAIKLEDLYQEHFALLGRNPRLFEEAINNV